MNNEKLNKYNDKYWMSPNIQWNISFKSKWRIASVDTGQLKMTGSGVRLLGSPCSDAYLGNLGIFFINLSKSKYNSSLVEYVGKGTEYYVYSMKITS